MTVGTQESGVDLSVVLLQMLIHPVIIIVVLLERRQDVLLVAGRSSRSRGDTGLRPSCCRSCRTHGTMEGGGCGAASSMRRLDLAAQITITRSSSSSTGTGSSTEKATSHRLVGAPGGCGGKGGGLV